MARNDPTRWTPQKIAKLVARAREKGATLEILGKRYGVCAAAVASVLRQAGVNKELSAQRKRWRMEEEREKRRSILADVMPRANGNVSVAAKMTHYSRATIEIWKRELLTPEDLEKIIVRPACIECGKPVVSKDPRAKICSAACKIFRKNKLKAKRSGSSWQLWQKRDYDELVISLKVCGGVVYKAAKMMGISRHAVHAAITRWGIRDELSDARAQRREEKIAQVAQMIMSGTGMMRAALSCGLHKRTIKEQLAAAGYGHLVHGQKCLHCGKIFTRQKIQDRCCSEECRKTMLRARWKKVRMRKAAIRNQRKNENVVIESQTIKRSKHL
jgi:DNA-binding protein Fis/predicted nucleic acid-binding Zn ribbon protein/lambda repressor-like predicted transcriptional regulator